MSPSALDLSVQAERRARLSSVLGRLLLSEPGADVGEVVAGIPELEPLSTGEEALWAEYERLFLREVPLYESIFLGEDGQRGGVLVSEVTDFYRRHDFDESQRWRVPSVDHLGIELRFYGHLASREATAWGDDRPEEASRLVEAERQFLACHLGQWGEVAIAAVRRRCPAGPYAALSAAVGEFLASEAERLRPAPQHPGMPEVALDEAPSRVGPARLARWLLAPSRCGAFLDVDDLAEAATSIGAPWRPSDARSRFRHVVESAIDGGDLDVLLAHLRPAIAQWRDAHALNEADRDGDRRVWIRWRQQAEETLGLLDRAASTRGEQATGLPVLVTVSGGDRHQRAAAAAEVIAPISAMGRRVAVSVDLHGRVGDDVEALLTAGAEEVLLASDIATALVVADGGATSDRERRHLRDADVVVRLVPGPGPLSAKVDGGTAADEVIMVIPAHLKD